MNQEQEKRFSLRTSLLWGTVALAVSSYFAFDVWAKCCPAGTTGLVSCAEGWCCDTQTTSMTTGMTTAIGSPTSTHPIYSTCDGGMIRYYYKDGAAPYSYWTESGGERCGETDTTAIDMTTGMTTQVGTSNSGSVSSVYTVYSTCIGGEIVYYRDYGNGLPYSSWTDVGENWRCNETTGMTTAISSPNYSSGGSYPVYSTCVGDYGMDIMYYRDYGNGVYSRWTDLSQNWRCRSTTGTATDWSSTGTGVGSTTIYTSEGRSYCDRGRLYRLDSAYDGSTYYTDAGPCSETRTTWIDTESETIRRSTTGMSSATGTGSDTRFSSNRSSTTNPFPVTGAAFSGTGSTHTTTGMSTAPLTTAPLTTKDPCEGLSGTDKENCRCKRGGGEFGAMVDEKRKFVRSRCCGFGGKNPGSDEVKECVCLAKGGKVIWEESWLGLSKKYADCEYETPRDYKIYPDEYPNGLEWE